MTTPNTPRCEAQLGKPCVLAPRHTGYHRDADGFEWAVELQAAPATEHCPLCRVDLSEWSAKTSATGDALADHLLDFHAVTAVGGTPEQLHKLTRGIADLLRTAERIGQLPRSLDEVLVVFGVESVSVVPWRPRAGEGATEVHVLLDLPGAGFVAVRFKSPEELDRFTAPLIETANRVWGGRS